MDLATDLSLAELSTAVLLGLGALLTAQVGLMLFSIRDIWWGRGPASGDRRLWTVLVALGSFIGALVYFSVGRAAASLPDTRTGAGSDPGQKTARAVEMLFESETQ